MYGKEKARMWLLDLLRNDEEVKEAVLKIVEDKFEEVMAEGKAEAEAERERLEDEQKIVCPTGSGLDIGD
jgi:hypothetical protein